jgi:hypothetical protein
LPGKAQNPAQENLRRLNRDSTAASDVGLDANVSTNSKDLSRIPEEEDHPPAK